VIASAAALAAFYAIGGTFLDWYKLDLGSTTLPRPRHTAFLFYWTLFGSLATFFLLIGVTRFSALRGPGSTTETQAESAAEAQWTAVAMFVAFLLPCAIRAFVLRGAVLTDDESAYRFMAQVLAGGRLTVESHRLPAFFDRVFMINDGKFYSTYFIGWPALMVPGVYAGLTGYMNAVYAACTVPALHSVARRLAGPGAARIATILFVTSPMLMVGAATEMSHTTCMLALAWSVYFLLRSLEQPAVWSTHACVAFFLSLAFFVRPTSALGVGVPVLAWWTTAMLRWPVLTRRRAIVSFAAPAALMAAAFLGVNASQNGSPFLTSYVRLQQYMGEVNYQNVGWRVEAPPVSIGTYILPHADFGTALAKSSIALMRLVFDLFGSPLVILLAALSWGTRSARLPALAAVGFVAVHFFLHDSGVDSFGPVHYFELSLPVLLLCAVGFGRLATLARDIRPDLPPSWPMAVMVSVVIVSLVGFAPVRLATLSVVAANVNGPVEALRDAGISHAVIFTAVPFVSQQCIDPARHFVFFRPNNDPELKNDILWVNDLGRERDHELMRYFPGRAAYVMTWESCKPRFQRL
jgi:hypothetical protein